MPILQRRSLLALCFALLALAAVSAACQPAPIQCCEMTYGLLQPTDLNGSWKPIEEEGLQLIQPTGRYDEKSVAEFKRSYYYGTLDESSDQRRTFIIHDLRRYDPIAPDPGKLKTRVNFQTPGGRAYDPGVLRPGLSSQTLCQKDDPSKSGSRVSCMAETRYSHFISTIYFYFDASVAKTEMKALINQALSTTDERVQEMDQRLNEVSY
jgi:hypothetical protein